MKIRGVRLRPTWGSGFSLDFYAVDVMYLHAKSERRGRGGLATPPPASFINTPTQALGL